MSDKLKLIINLIKKNPNYPKNWKDLSDILNKQNKKEQANIAFRKYLELLDEESTDDEEEIRRNKIMKKMDSNKLIQKKLLDPEFQKKLINNKNNPFSLLGDKDMMDIMKEMFKEL